MLLMSLAMVTLTACGGQSAALADTNQAKGEETAAPEKKQESKESFEINVGDITGGEVPYDQFKIALEKRYFEEE